MKNQSLNRASIIKENPTHLLEAPRVNMDVLRLRLIEEKKKDKIKKTIIFSTIFLFLGTLSFLTY